MAIASVHNPRVNNPLIESKVLAERVNLVFAGSLWTHVLFLLVAGLLAIQFFDSSAPEVVFWWAAAVALVEISRMLLASSFNRNSIPSDQALAWLNRARVASLMTAVAWATTALLFFPVDSVVNQLSLAVLLLGCVALGMPNLSRDFVSFVPLVALTSMALAGQFFLLAELHAWIAGGTCIAVGALLLLHAWRMQQETIESLRMRFAYADIAEEFDTEVTTRINAENTLRRGERRGRKQSYILLDLAKEDAISSGDLPRALHVITSKAAQAIRCTRISVWLCEPDYSEFRCVHVYDNGYHDASPDLRLQTGNNAHLYKRLERMRTFAIDDAVEDRRVQDFQKTYIQPYKITSVLGAPFRHGGKVRGVIVHEHVGGQRNWSRDERMFCSSLADFIALAISASGRQQVQEQLRQMANYDRLTGLPNRTMFHDRLRHAMSKARRANRQIALLFVDVDRFKAVNDSLGHAIGDRVLRTIAKRLGRCVRNSDTVARLGGDEFTVILEELEEIDTVIHVTERIISMVAERILIGDSEIQLTCSVGIAHYPTDATDAETLLQNADTAMYRAKKNGRNRYQFFTADMHAQALSRLERESEIRKAVSRNQFVLHYQPLLDVNTGEMLGVEALIRWQHPQLGLLTPAEFIPLAEEIGLIDSIGEWVIKTACMQAMEWYTQFDRRFHMAINLSVGQFKVRTVPGLIREVLAETGLPPELLLLEITESLAMEEAEQTLSLLEELRSIGCRLALDDFGTGNSSLSYLKKFPVDIIKVDRSFVKDLDTDEHNAAIARATIGLANSLGLQTIAEGVETEQQRDWLKSEGCEIMQGFLFSPPLPPDEIPGWFKRPTRLVTRKKGKAVS